MAGIHTKVTRQSTASCNVVVDGAWGGECDYSFMPFDTVAVGLPPFAGGTVDIIIDSDVTLLMGDPDGWEFLHEDEWYARVTVRAGNLVIYDTDTYDVLLCEGSYKTKAGVLGEPACIMLSYTDYQPITIPFAFGSSAYLKLFHTETPGRNNDNYTTHLMECALEDVWYIDDSVTFVSTSGEANASAIIADDEGEYEIGGEYFGVNFTGHTAHDAGTLVSIEDVELSGIVLDFGQLEQYSDRNWARGWQYNDSSDYLAVGSGNTITISCLNDASAYNDWSGGFYAPRAVSFEHLYARIFDKAGAALDPVVETRCFDIDGLQLVDYASNLRSMGQIVDPRVYSWIAQNSTEAANGYVWWEGYYPAAQQYFRMQDAWLKANNEYRCVKSGEEGYVTHDDSYIPIWGWGYQATDRESDPTFTGVFSAVHVATVNVNDPPTTSVRTGAYRPSQWQGSGGLTIPGDNDTWLVDEEATDPTVSRTFSSVWFERNSAVPDEGEETTYEHGELPDAFLYNKANMDPDHPEPAGTQTMEDITNWDNHSFLRVGFANVPQVATLTFTVNYKTVQCYDNKDVDTRAEEYYYITTSHSQEYTLNFTETGSGKYVDVDLINGPEDAAALILQHVTSVSISGFPVDTEWELDTFELREHDSVFHFNHLKAIMPWKYVETFLSGVVDGKRTLAIPDDYQINLESTLPYLNWRFSSVAGDLTPAFTLLQIRNILDGQEGYTATYSTSGYANNYQDEEDPVNTLCAAHPWHLQPEAHRDEDGDGWSWPMAIIVGYYTIAPGILYEFWNTDPESAKLLRGGAHGVAFYNGQRSTGDVTIYIWARPQGSSGWGSSIGTATFGDLGYWTYENCQVVQDQGDNSPYDDVLWEYGYSTVDDNEEVTTLGVCENREWIIHSVAAAGAACDALSFVKYEAARFYVGAYASDGKVYVQRYTYDGTAYGDAVEIGTGSCPSLVMLPGANLLLFYYDGTNIAYTSSRNAAEWSSATTFAAAKQCPWAKVDEHTGTLYVTCLDTSGVLYVYNVVTATLSAGVVSLTVPEAITVASGASTSYVPKVWVDQASHLVGISYWTSSDDLQTYSSKNGEEWAVL